MYTYGWFFHLFNPFYVSSQLDKLKEFNSKVDEELRLSDSQLLTFIKSADPSSNLEGIHHLEKLLLWPAGKYLMTSLTHIFTLP